jgi:hypothetical protein
MLHGWYKSNRCGIPLAAKPGKSNHEDGGAIDCQASKSWRVALQKHGWKWLGPQDQAHYSYRGDGYSTMIGVLGVKAFQLLYNEHDKGGLRTDGVFDAKTDKAMRASPADGWEIAPERTPTRVYVDGQPVTGEAYVEAGTSWAAVRPLLEPLGMWIVSLDDDEQAITLQRGEERHHIPCRVEPPGVSYTKQKDYEFFEGITVGWENDAVQVSQAAVT